MRYFTKSKSEDYEKKQNDRFNAGVTRYNELLEKAKAAGVKGVRSGMRTSTIKDKMREHGITVDSEILACDEEIDWYALGK